MKSIKVFDVPESVNTQWGFIWWLTKKLLSSEGVLIEIDYSNNKDES